jgi:hypothetical protein
MQKQIHEFAEFGAFMMTTAVSHDALYGYPQLNIRNAFNNHEDCSDMSQDAVRLIFPKQFSSLRGKSMLCLYHPW